MAVASGVMLASVVGEGEPVFCQACSLDFARWCWRIGAGVIFCPHCGAPRDIADVINEYREESV